MIDCSIGTGVWLAYENVPYQCRIIGFVIRGPLLIR